MTYMFSYATNFNSGINIVLWNRKVNFEYDKVKFTKHLIKKWQRVSFALGKLCIYFKLLHDEIV